MSLPDLIILVLATGQTIETWRHGSLFEEKRAEIEVWEDGWRKDLLRCMFCLSHWAAALMVFLFGLAALLDSPLSWLVQFPVYVLAVTRGAQLLNDVTKRCCRTPNQRISEKS